MSIIVVCVGLCLVIMKNLNVLFKMEELLLLVFKIGRILFKFLLKFLDINCCLWVFI